MLKIGLDTESLHLWFQNKRMDIFGFIEKAHQLGFDGVMINILKDYNLGSGMGHTGKQRSGTPEKSPPASGKIQYVCRTGHQRHWL